MKRLVWFFFGCLGVWAQGPIVAPTALANFTYTMNSGVFPASQTLKVTLPAGLSTLPVQVSNALASGSACSGKTSSCGWLQVTPDLGNAPLTLSVSVNPTGLTPGNFNGSFVVDTVPSSGLGAVTIKVVLQISNPPSTLRVTSPNFTGTTAPGTDGSLNFMYTTGNDISTLTSAQLNVSSSGDIIPFNVTIANAKSGTGSSSTAIWLRVGTNSTGSGNLATSGSAGVGSLVPIYVTLDYAAIQGLGIGQYNAVITVTPATSNTKLNVPQTVLVGLVVSAGAPTVMSVFPSSVVPAQPTDPVFTIYGTNFTANTSVFLETYVGLDLDNGATQIATSRLTLVSPKILQVKVPTASLPTLHAGYTYPYICILHVSNGGFPEAPGPNNTFTVTNPSLPSISLIVNAANFVQMSKFNGDGSVPDPATVPNGNPTTAVSPRGVISIFGQNLGPSVASIPTTIPCPADNTYTCYPTKSGTPSISVSFYYWDGTLTKPGYVTVYAPILMTSINQINAIVPASVANVLYDPSKAPTATVKVLSGTASSAVYKVTVLAADPGIFTFGGLGQGQGAIINYDSGGAASINSSTNQEPRGNIIAVFVTGMGDLDSSVAVIPDGALTMTQTALADALDVQLFIGGQPAVVQYAGTSPGAVAGLVQINAIVPPTATTGVVPITLSVGPAATNRLAQTGVIIGVKK
jgi:uncharacterized protein (TIGR03437 family)